MPKPAHRNTSNSSHLQALLDLIAKGHGSLTIDQAAKMIEGNRKLAAELQQVWNGHLYPEKAITWVQLTCEISFACLSPDALKILVILGTNAHQNGLIRMKIKDIAGLAQIGIRTTKQVMGELLNRGCIAIARPAKGHYAPIYAVNPALINKGKRLNRDLETFAQRLDISQKDYIGSIKPPLIAQKTSIYERDQEGLVFNNVIAVPPPQELDEKKPSDARQTANHDALEGSQMMITDYQEVIPECPEY